MRTNDEYIFLTVWGKKTTTHTCLFDDFALSLLLTPCHPMPPINPPGYASYLSESQSQTRTPSPNPPTHHTTFLSSSSASSSFFFINPFPPLTLSFSFFFFFFLLHHQLNPPPRHPNGVPRPDIRRPHPRPRPRQRRRSAATRPRGRLSARCSCRSLLHRLLRYHLRWGRRGMSARGSR